MSPTVVIVVGRSKYKADPQYSPKEGLNKFVQDREIADRG